MHANVFQIKIFACPGLALSSFEQPSPGAPLLGLAKSLLILFHPSNQSIPRQYVEYYLGIGAFIHVNKALGGNQAPIRKRAPIGGTTLNQITVNINSFFKKGCPTNV